MPGSRPQLLYVTDLAYPAKGRRYGDEDVWLTSRLRAHFDLALCHPLDAVALMDGFDGVVVRNSGPVLGHRAAYDAFRAKARATGAKVFTSLDGKADMAGKQYLVDLHAAGEPVIPTVDAHADRHRLPDAAAYVAKPKLGADSIGLEVVAAGQVDALVLDGTTLLQPRVDIACEVSFYAVDREVLYALTTRDAAQRWELAPFTPSAADLAFAQRFLDWNAVAHGIQRVDGCRTTDGELLLVEVEDLNPYLSLDRVDDATRERFVAAMAASLSALLGA